MNGIDRDGLFAFLFGLAILALVLYQGPDGWSRGSLAACALLGLLIILLEVRILPTR
ncbi:MAG: hypothetical protein V5A55_11525 [Halovenus sp.]